MSGILNSRWREMLRMVVVIIVMVGTPMAFGKPLLVKDGQAQAEIILAEKPTRTMRLAAQELQRYVEKISGAKLAIRTAPSGEVPVSAYVGQSAHTEKLGITAKGLKYGAYRIASGDNWVVFIGDDSDFTPIEPWPRNYTDIRSGKMQDAWNKITGENWGYPHTQLHKHYSGIRQFFGTPKEPMVDKNGNVNVWTYDERGSFNAVCGFLRSLGVRWYMPGEIGEVVPKLKTIPAPQGDKTVTPDFPMRILNFRAGLYGRDAMMYGFRLGTRQPYGRQAAHGLATMTRNETVRKEHPEWFALYGGKRHTSKIHRNHQLCYSNEELLKQAVRFAQVQFDHYKMDVVSIMPPDGYTAICQCPKCRDKESPELGERGRLSNYIWEFVNRVAKEVAKTHPNKKISNCAYGVYTNPPSNIKKLEPNIQVIIVGGRRPVGGDQVKLRKLREGWAKKTDNPIEIFENYPFTGRGWYLPSYVPKVMGASINATKGMSRGEDVWITMDFKDKAIGYNHFLLYFTGRMYWGGKKQDASAMFDEYVRLFYGPVASEMAAFFKYSEANWQAMEKNLPKADQALKLFDAAKAKAPADSVYAKRVQLIDNYLNSLRNKRTQLAQKRGPVPVMRLLNVRGKKIVIDGKLDDDMWKRCPQSSAGTMWELQTGRMPIYATRVKSLWVGNDLYLAIRCEDRPGEKLNIATTKNGDQAIWQGDAVEILLDTNMHSYYQIVVNPAGALIDLDRGTTRYQWFKWASQAEVATQAGDGYWTIEIRIPVTADANDPHHRVIGRKPTKSLPWHINICRQRIRESGSEYSAISPTGTANFHAKMKFAHFYAGLSHRFPADESVTDHVIASRKAVVLARRRKYAEAMAIYLDLASQKKATDFQKSDALTHAAECARRMRDHAQAAKLAGQIPIEAVKKTVSMENLLAQRKYDAVIAQFGSEDLSQWPFWQIGAGAFARGRTFAVKKQGEKAEADLKLALEYTPNPRTRTTIITRMGQNRESLLKDDEGALKAYRKNFEGKKSIGAADAFRALEGAARILTRQGKHDEALATLKLAKVEKLKGHWKHAMLIAIGKVQAAAGKKEDALKSFQAILDDAKAKAYHKKAAQKAIEELGKQ
jgi:Domain of unknown function (DUF4838)/Carbohydrate family 9 binding domain-like